MSHIKRVVQSVTLLGLMVLLTGCPPKKKPTVEEVTPPVEELKPVETTDLTPKAIEVGTGDYTLAPEVFGPIYFDYNKSDIRADARDTLKKNAGVLKAILKQYPSIKVRIEGHCDDRGTVEYNLALGEKRAKAVVSYYGTLGVKKSAMTTISYGEEHPVCSDAAENCWWKNRRSETTLKSTGQPLSIPIDQLPK